MEEPIAHFEIHTTGFHDTEAQRQERVNSEAGAMSLAIWLATELEHHGYKASEPWAEDHGSDFSVSKTGKTYLIVCNAPEDPGLAAGEPRWGTITVALHRSMFSRLLRRGGSREDEIVPLLVGILQSHPSISSLQAAWR